jgi:hypothetical protein
MPDVVEVITSDETLVEIVVPGPAGAAGSDGADGADGVGVPVGGTTGQALVKNSNTDYDTEWADVVASPGGSTTQVQFNDAGALAGDAGLTYDKTTNALTIGAGSLKFTGGTSGTVTIQPAATAGTYALTLPTDDGASGQALLTDGSGVLSWGAVGGTPGGSTTQVQYNNAGAFAGASGITTTGTEFTIASGTKTASAPVLDMSQTWNNGAVTFTGIKLNITSTAYAAASAMMDLQASGSSIFKFGRDGVLTNYGLTMIGSNPWIKSTNGLTFLLADSESSTSGSSSYISAGATPGKVDIGVSNTRAARFTIGTLCLGAADAAAPVAQTLSVQSATGVSNTAGANLTITGSQGTGTGAGGSIIFQVAPAGSTGSAQNALATALTIASDKTSTFEAAVVGKANISVQNEQGFQVYASGNTNRALIITNFSGAPMINMASDWSLNWGSSTTVNTSYDTSMWRIGAGIVGVRGSSITTGGALAFVEQTAPSAPGTNGVYIYAEDNGGGKTRLMALFPTGAAQQIAIEP